MISLCMIVKNEEHNLERCLRSAKDCVDEIIIVDTGSSDNTVNIAKQFGAKVFYYQWDDDFAVARNFSISKASGDWIFYLDADEELEPNCCDRFRALTNNHQAEGYYYQINNLNDNNNPLRHINIRMFRNKPEYRFEGPLHEQIICAIQNSNKKGAPVIKNSEINIFHYGYLSSEFISKNKSERNYRINKKMVEKEPNNPFCLYNLGNCLVNLNDIEGAAANYRKALEYINLKALYAPSIFIAYISCLLKLGQLDEAIKQIEKCKSQYPDYADIHFVEGELFTRLGHVNKGKLCFEKCLSIGEQSNGKYTTKTGVGSFLPLLGLAQIYKSQGDIDKAIYNQIQGLKLKNYDIKDFITLAQLLKSHVKDSYNVLHILKKVVKHADKVNEKLILARLLNEIEEYDLSIKLLDELPTERSDVCYLKGLALIKTARYNEAIQLVKQIKSDTGIYQTTLQELILAYWLSTPPIDASQFIQQSNFQDQELYQTLKYINDMLFNRQSELKVSFSSKYFNQIVNKIISLKQIGLILKILTLCGLDTPESKIGYLITAPVSDRKIELAAKLALQELKQGLHQTDYYFVLAWYFFNNDELDIAQNKLNQALTVNPEVPQYRQLLKDIYRKQSLKIVLAALKNYPDNPEFNKYLIAIQKDLINGIILKGAH